MIRLAICTALLAIVAGGARAQSATEALRSDCFDDNMTDRCDASVQRRVRERFDLRAIEQLSDANIQVRRVFFVDGHGGELPVVSFERAPGERPQVHVSALVENRGAHRVATLTAPVSLATWNEIIEQSRYIHRRLAEEPAPAEEPVPSGFVRVPGMCLHSWVITVEASDPGAGVPTRSATQDTCNDGLVVPFADRAAALALQALPSCSGIKTDDIRTPITALSLCALLGGDTVSAGEALNQAMMLRVSSNASLMLIHDRAEIDWQGESISGFEAIRAWPRLIDQNLLEYLGVSGRDADHVSITGDLVEYERNTQGYPRHRTARFEQTWVRGNGFDFRLRTMRVNRWSDWSE